jgi:hypothetical protein
MVSGIVNDALVISIRNLGYTRNAGELVRKLFGEMGNAGGHRAMAKAVIPWPAFVERFGQLTDDQINTTLRDLTLQYLREHTPTDKKK